MDMPMSRNRSLHSIEPLKEALLFMTPRISMGRAAMKNFWRKFYHHTVTTSWWPPSLESCGTSRENLLD